MYELSMYEYLGNLKPKSVLPLFKLGVPMPKVGTSGISQSLSSLLGIMIVSQGV